MSYASADDISEMYGEQLLLRIADPDDTGYFDVHIVKSALEQADDIIDSYLSTRYTLPLRNTPGILKACAIDIAVYKMAHGRLPRTDEMRIRYEDALRMLELIAKGTIGLGLPADGDDTLGEDGSGINPNLTNRGRFFNVRRS